jgi:hypothetical protein
MQLRGGDLPAAQGTFVRAAEAARKLGSAEMLARAALGYGGRFVWTKAGGDPRVVSLLEDALAVMPKTDSPLRARLLARRAGALRSQPTGETRVALSAEAVGICPAAGGMHLARAGAARRRRRCWARRLRPTVSSAWTPPQTRPQSWRRRPPLSPLDDLWKLIACSNGPFLSGARRHSRRRRLSSSSK